MKANSKLQAARQRLRSWRENPCQFVHDNFKVDLDNWQVEALNSLTTHNRICMKACTGPGKTATLSWAGWYRMACFGKPDMHPKGAALSVTSDNLKDNLWPELSAWQQRSEFLKSQFTWTKERIYANDYPETWFLSARSYARNADAAAIGRALSGLHSPYPFVLLDETGDMPTAVGRSADQIFTGSPINPIIIQAGNPTSTTGLLYQSCNMPRLWHVITITADPDDPNRTPRVSIQHAREQIEEWGRDNPWIMATILGLFPSSAINTLLTDEEVEQAMNRHYRPDVYQHAAKILSLDVAREGLDSSVLTQRQGLVSLPMKKFRGLTSFPLANQVAAIHNEWRSDGVIVDGTGGFGAGVIDALDAMGITAFDCQFAGKADNPKFFNKRAQILWDAAQWVKGGGALAPDERLKKQMTSLTYSYKGDRIIMEPKEMFKARIGHSPDEFDSLGISFAFPIAAASSGYGTANSSRAETEYNLYD